MSVTQKHSTIYGCIHYPKSRRNTDSDAILKHVSDVMVIISTKHSDRFVIGGDYNHLDMTDLATLFDLTNIVQFPTRQNAYLDKIFTNIDDLKTSTLEKLAPLQDSDHDIIFLQKTTSHATTSEKITYHHVTRESQIAIERDIAQLDWSNITSVTDPNSKAIAIHSTISNIVNRHCPIKCTIFFPGLFFYVYIESPNTKNPEGPTPQAPNPIN